MYWLDKLKAVFTDFNPLMVVEILAIFAVLFLFFGILLKNNATKIVWAYVFFTLATAAFLFFYEKDGEPIKNAPLYMLIFQTAFIVSVLAIFATEIKRDIWTKRTAHKHERTGEVTDSNVCIEEIIKAVQNMSKADVGAIIILSNNNLPSGILESGVYLDADISSQLIESVFFPKTALHDGAMVVNGTRIQAAGCFLPVAQEVNISKDLGSRHRAGIGLTETVNVTAIIVSEETGIISIASGGKIVRYVDTTALRTTLKEYYWQDMID